MITIYEPIYRPEQVLSEKSFIAYPHTSNDKFKKWREFRLHIEVYRAKLYENNKLTGIFSPKFGLKTHLSGEEFIAYCQSASDADVVFVNPFPQMRYRSYNIWMQAESNHPGITNCAQNLLTAAGIDIDIEKQPRHDHKTLAYSSFWVGSPTFWEQYVGGLLEKLAVFIEHNENHPAVVNALVETFHTDPTPFLPFITERLFTTYLSLHPELKVSSISLDPLDFCLMEAERKFVQSIIPEIDRADQLGSFSPELVHRMEEHCDALAQAARVHFRDTPHPHTGRTIT
ncbi:hypothetical protein [Hydrogenophaga sp. PAMC20947]|uniref:hypothetical protein n=1 Tax=Hydrogenophaga sp. PAMC20947 TaxID=2565558 RepID=UPI00109DD3D7|nr:hypothetical protein [Hydrogenophaga sp. PAMC20947]QCB46337.1 hypothetical protein E5678_10065 [Hydrogenophaga sp. PAMC20947]